MSALWFSLDVRAKSKEQLWPLLEYLYAKEVFDFTWDYMGEADSWTKGEISVTVNFPWSENLLETAEVLRGLDDDEGK